MNRKLVISIVAVLATIIAGVAGFFGTIAYIGHQRVSDATPAFEPIEHLGCHIFSQPVAFYRHCRYIVMFSPSSKLSDDNAAELHSLNQLPDKNWLELEIDTPAVTDAALSSLKQIKALDTLDVTKSSISDAGIEELKLALPGCDVAIREPRQSSPETQN